MMMNNKKCQNRKLALSAVLLGVALYSTASFAQTGLALSDHGLSGASGEAGVINQESIQRVKQSVENSSEKQSHEVKHLVRQHSQNIQENNLEGSEMSDYILQKKKADDKARIRQTEKTLPVDHITYRQQYDNITVTYPNGIVITSRH